MSQQGSYQISTIASNIEKELDRLKAQVGLFWDKELKHYKEFGLIDGMSVVEIGSGPGFLSEKILEHFGSVHITMMEIDPLLVDYSKRYLAQKHDTRYDISQGSITETGLPENTFDFAIIRLVLEHLPDPIDAVREIFRILKPGGKAVFVDNDFEMHIITYPQILQLRELYDAYCKSRYSEGGNPRIGRNCRCL
ncbi:class I SAM-dependent methyltransferase [Paenibacillus hexagrammi]|uniref:Class I SAM-dependent methyltransferase n=1 Tax=Paenibacillus hexagrammi TaxID=2908839 RepID=A0ABY3SLN8_9BACL|nr:class I SAM-dependent methyltransferase [Paenibacillus sp. YPD9-1]UJF34757.1 class I SAM-dependent methyltransferase [Paenibacillus sp. YPD9-1]